MTMYRPVHRSGACALLRDSMTGANLFIIQQSCPSDWRIELIAWDERTDGKTLADFQWDQREGQRQAEERELLTDHSHAEEIEPLAPGSDGREHMESSRSEIWRRIYESTENNIGV